MSRFARLTCSKENHGQMPFEFICLAELCQHHGKWLSCLSCCDEFHHSHKKDLVTVKAIVVEMEEACDQSKGHMLDILLGGLSTCCSEEDLRSNLAELLAYRRNPVRFEKPLDEEMEAIQSNTRRHYQRINERQTARTVSERSTVLSKPFISPVLSFKESQHYLLSSPFCLQSRDEQMMTVFAQPSLSKFHESVKVRLRVDRCTPSWLAVGLSVGQSKY